MHTKLKLVEEFGKRSYGAETYAAFCGNPSLYRATTAAPPRPMLCCKATFTPSTCLLFAIPLSCQHNSEH